MVLKALLQHASMASCAKLPMIAPNHASIRTSQSNFYTTKALHAHCRIVDSKACQGQSMYKIVSLPKPKPLINRINADSYQNSSFSEHWIEDIICDIVKHINEAPFLQLLFDSEDDSTMLLTQRQGVPAGNCLSADEKWKQMERHIARASPDGVVLVHHLQGSFIGGRVVGDGLGTDTAQGDANANVIEKGIDGKDLWGILVLGREIAKNACYILETTKVVSSIGTCTSFCLTKAQSFGPSWHDQLQSSWLLKTDNSDTSLQ